MFDLVLVCLRSWGSGAIAMSIASAGVLIVILTGTIQISPVLVQLGILWCWAEGFWADVFPVSSVCFVIHQHVL